MEKAKELDLLSDALFKDSPARGGSLRYDNGSGKHPYLQSYLFSLIRVRPPEGYAPTRYCDYDLLEYVRNEWKLGPYEKQLLGDILMAPGNVVLCAGSTGSGKSSAIGAILDFLEENSQATVHIGRTVSRLCSCRVDCNKLFSDYEKKMAIGESVANDWLFEKISYRIPGAILASLRTEDGMSPKPSVRLAKLAGDAYKWASGESQAPGSGKFDAPIILQVGPIEQTGSVESFNKLNATVNQLPPEDRLEYWFSLLEALARMVRGGVGRQLVLLLDNIDPFPLSAQIAIRDKVLALATDSSFKVVVPVRFSTYRVLNAAMGFNFYAHSGPSPVDVICRRLWSFIIDPDQYKAFTNLTDPKWKQRAVLRAFDLLLRLTRGTGTYRSLGQMIAASAGDSVRRGLKAARALFESSHLTFDYDDNALEHLKVLRVYVEAVTSASQLAHCLREELISCTLELQQPGTLGTWVQESSRRAFGVVQRVMEAAVDASSTADTSGPWSHVALVDYCNDDLGDVHVVLRESLKDANCDPDLALAELSRSILSLVSGWLGRKGTREAEIADFLGRVVSIIESGSEETSSSEEMEFPIEWDPRKVVQKTLKANPAYLGVRVLVENRKLHNLLRNPKGDPSILPLAIIYKIVIRYPERTTVGDILEEIGLAGLSERDQLHLLNSLSRHSARVIWADGDFEKRSLQEWRALSDHRVDLLHSGWLYVGSVLDEFDYLMNMLAHEVADRWFSDRLGSTLRGLKRLDAIGSRTHAFEGISPNIAFDLTVRTTRAMLSAACGHFNRIAFKPPEISPAERLKELNRTRRAVESWLRYLQASSRIRKVLSPPRDSNRRAPHGWWIAFGRAGRIRGDGPANRRRRVESTITALEDALRGTRLWIVGLNGDRFRSDSRESDSAEPRSESNDSR